jgi:hypothetical protein
VESVMATVNTVSHGRADQGGGENSSLHDEQIISKRRNAR